MGIIFRPSPSNYQYIVGQSNLVNYAFNSVNQTMPQTDAVLHNNIVIPGKTIVQNGQRLSIHAKGNMGAHGASAPTISARLNNNIVFTGTSAANGSGHMWEMLLEFFCVNFGNNQSVLFGKFGTNGLQAGVGAVIETWLAARNFVSPFGLVAGQGFNDDHTLSFTCTDGTGTEIITQEITYITIQ